MSLFHNTKYEFRKNKKILLLRLEIYHTTEGVRESHGFQHYWVLKCEQSTLRKALLKQKLSLHAHAHTPWCYHIYMLGRSAMPSIR